MINRISNEVFDRKPQLRNISFHTDYNFAGIPLCFAANLRDYKGYLLAVLRKNLETLAICMQSKALSLLRRHKLEFIFLNGPIVQW